MQVKKRITSEFIGYKAAIASLLRKLSFVSAPDIEDILQETYVRTYQSALEREIRFPKAFMVKTALRLANQQREKSAKLAYNSNEDIEKLHSELYVEDRQHLGGGKPEQEYVKLQEFRLLCDVINQLPAQCRKVFIMKKIYGLSQQEIAQTLGLSESTVEKHVAKGVLYCGRSLNAAATHSPKIDNQNFVNKVPGKT